jgi:hypothetical protein
MMVLLEQSLYMAYNEFFKKVTRIKKSNVNSHVQHAYWSKWATNKWATKRNILLIFPLKFMYVQVWKRPSTFT